MSIDQIIAILLALATTCGGAIIGALCIKFIGSNEKNNISLYFYGFSVLTILTTIICAWVDRAELFSPNWLGLTVVIVAIASGIGFIFFTKKYLVVESVYEIKQLDPIINSFTEDADKTEIRLFAGDLDFFGVAPRDMDKNKQYTCLKSAGFNQILILCIAPNDTTDKIRYGKILSDFSTVQLRFYEPAMADLRIRGRMKELQGVTKLLIYTKIKSGVYKAIETDTANSHGKLYDNIWKLIWSSAKKPLNEQMEEYKSLLK